MNGVEHPSRPERLPTILVVEDNPDNMKLVAWALEDQGYISAGATSAMGQAATLSLYDPGRILDITRKGTGASREALFAARALRRHLAARALGEGALPEGELHDGELHDGGDLPELPDPELPDLPDSDSEQASAADDQSVIFLAAHRVADPGVSRSLLAFHVSSRVAARMTYNR